MALIQRLGKEALNVLFLIWLASILMLEDFGAFYIGLMARTCSLVYRSRFSSGVNSYEAFVMHI